MMKKNIENGPAPSMRAASFCSLSSDWMAVSRISSANGSHCQATMMMTEVSGQSAEEVDRRQPERAREEREQPVDRVHQHVLPDQRAHRRHDEERRDREQARDAAAVEVLVEQHGEQRAEADGDQRAPSRRGTACWPSPSRGPGRSAGRCSCRSRRSRRPADRAGCSTGTRTTASSPAARSSTGRGRSPTARRGAAVLTLALAARGRRLGVGRCGHGRRSDGLVLAIVRIARGVEGAAGGPATPAARGRRDVGREAARSDYLSSRPASSSARSSAAPSPAPASTVTWPARAAAICWPTVVPMPWNSGMATYWMPI